MDSRNEQQPHPIRQEQAPSQSKGFLSQLKERFSAALRKNPELQKMPPLEIDFRFSAHGKKSHFEDVDLSQYDVYFPEGLGQDTSAIQTIRAVSSGELNPKKAMEKLKSQYSGHLWGQLKAINNSGVAIGGIDPIDKIMFVDEEARAESL